jgi:hypothetical protein
MISYNSFFFQRFNDSQQLFAELPIFHSLSGDQIEASDEFAVAGFNMDMRRLVIANKSSDNVTATPNSTHNSFKSYTSREVSPSNRYPISSAGRARLLCKHDL